MVAAWIRALTGVGPSIASGSQTCKGNCADLPTAPQKISKPDHRRRRVEQFRVDDQLLLEAGKIERPGDGPDQDNAGEKTKIAQAIGQEGLFGRVGRRGALVPETDEQIAAQADQFPKNKHLEEIIADHHAEHGEGEQAHAGKKPRKAGVAPHVADGINMNGRPHARSRSAASAGSRDPSAARNQRSGGPLAANERQHPARDRENKMRQQIAGSEKRNASTAPTESAALRRGMAQQEQRDHHRRQQRQQQDQPRQAVRSWVRVSASAKSSTWVVCRRR